MLSAACLIIHCIIFWISIMVLDPDKPQENFPQLKYPFPREWLIAKHLQDGADGLWRFYYNSYEIIRFGNSHTSGSQWTNFTKCNCFSWSQIYGLITNYDHSCHHGKSFVISNMVPNPDRRQESFPQLKYPLLRDTSLKTPQQWLMAKQLQDGADGLWRIHDNLYDFTNFGDSHPGGSQWINITKGTDITEPFETHHLKGIADKLLPEYFVRKATTPRNSPFTFAEDGFYKTLKNKVVEKLDDIPKNVKSKSDMFTDSLLFALLVLAPLSCWVWQMDFRAGAVLTLISGAVLSSMSICSHSYLHRANNWRMYLINMIGYDYSEWRIFHALSHHMHTNTAQDLELSMFEPYVQFMPREDKSIWAQMGAFYCPIVYMFTALERLIKDLILGLIGVHGKKLEWSNMIAFFLPAWMWCFGGQPLIMTLGIWLLIMCSSSFLFLAACLTTGHHTNKNFFDGDIPRDEYLDWGEHQLDTIVQGVERMGSGKHFISLIALGDHVLHHLFPTLDQGQLQYLYPIFLEHCKEFGTLMRTTTLYENFIGHSKQLIRKHKNNFRKNNYANGVAH